MTEDVYMYRVPLPDRCYEVVIPDADDDGYTVYISDRLSDQRAEQSYKHALRHITGLDFDLHESIQDIEYNAHFDKEM